MPIKPKDSLIQVQGRPLRVVYVTCDGKEFSDIEEAAEHDNKFHAKDAPKPIYDYVTSFQQAINMAVDEKRVVRFLSKESNANARKKIDDLKGCKLRKPSKESNDVAVIPPSVDPNSFDFDEVDMSMSVKGD
jgi:hypothetical protein